MLDCSTVRRTCFGPPTWLVGGLLVLATLGPGAAWAAVPKPWVPPAADSLVAWSSEAKARFQTQKGDSAHGANFRAFELVGRMGRRMLRTLGQESVAQAAVVEAVMDSLGLDTELVIDPQLPHFVLLMVRNPYRLTSDAVGFLYWFTADDLRMQGVVFRGGFRPRMRVWWTGKTEGPYEWGILDQERDPEGNLELVFLRMVGSGGSWSILQYDGGDGELGSGGDAYWVDVNGDNTPEVVAWAKAAPDSAFEECAGCPGLLTELTFTLHGSRFELHDSRLFPSPFATFVLFIRLLRDGNRAAAARLLADPAKVQDAIALGWGAKRKGVDWKLEYVEPDQAWPRWLAMRYLRGEGRPIYIVRFSMKDARWIIEDWSISRGRGGKSATPGGARPR